MRDGKREAQASVIRSWQTVERQPPYLGSVTMVGVLITELRWRHHPADAP